MDRSITLANRLREVLLNGQWIAQTNFKMQLEDINWEQATQKIGTLNTIASITYHVNYYIAGVLKVLKGGKLDIQDNNSFNLPPVESESDWNNITTDFLSNSERFIKEVARIPDTMLDEPFVDEDFGTYLRNIEAILEHSYYHLGQISLLKKWTNDDDKL